MRTRCLLLNTIAGLILLCAVTTGAQSTNKPASALTRPTYWATKIEKSGCPNLHLVTTNLFRGAQPTAAGMAELQSMGVKMIVNLRHFHSDRDELKGTELKQGRLHMDPWRPRDDDVIQFLKLAADTNNHPIFVHCQRGADRTGMVCAMYRIVLCDWTKEEAIKELKEGGFGYYSGWKSIVRYIEKADIDRIKERAGIGARK
jgi:protein tyrosine phosphatase (PTP) superfamily phosphohydrolase (DUF442 family)